MKDMIQKLIVKYYAIGCYALVGGASWLIDAGIFVALVQTAKMPVYLSSIISMLCSGCFNYFFSTHLVFDSGKVFHWRKLFMFIAYVLGTMLIWSAILTVLVHAGFWPIMAKIAIMPFTFYINFLFMGWLQEGRLRWH